MTWFASSSNQTAATADHAEIVAFVYMDFASGVLRLHTRTGNLYTGLESPDQPYLGVGDLGGIDIVKEDAQLRPNAIKLTLSGVDSALITTAMTEDYHGRDVAIYLGMLSTSTGALVDTPETVFRGTMDYMVVELGSGVGSIVVNCESELARWQRPRGLLYTHESQQLIYEGDRFFDMVPTIQTRVVDWSKKTQLGLLNNAVRGISTRQP